MQAEVSVPAAVPVPEAVPAAAPVPAPAAPEAPVAAAPAPAPAAEVDLPELKPIIEYDTFALMDLRVGRVLTAERVPKSKKLIKMSVDVGFETRTILAGIGVAYAPEELVDCKVVVVANLAPRALMGTMSHGMLLAASDNSSKPYLVAPPADAQPGFVVR